LACLSPDVLDGSRGESIMPEARPLGFPITEAGSKSV
jgi:hypothetical protein